MVGVPLSKGVPVLLGVEVELGCRVRYWIWVEGEERKGKEGEEKVF